MTNQQVMTLVRAQFAQRQRSSASIDVIGQRVVTVAINQFYASLAGLFPSASDERYAFIVNSQVAREIDNLTITGSHWFAVLFQLRPQH